MAACSRSLRIRHFRHCIAACRPVPRHVATHAASGWPTCWMAFRMRALCDRCRCARRRPRSCRSTSLARSSRSMFGAMTSRRYRLYAMQCVALLHGVRRMFGALQSCMFGAMTSLAVVVAIDGRQCLQDRAGTWAHPVLARRTRRPVGPAAAKVGLPLAVLFAADSRCSTAAVP